MVMNGEECPHATCKCDGCPIICSLDGSVCILEDTNYECETWEAIKEEQHEDN